TARRLDEGLRQAAVDAGVPVTTARVGSMLTVFFSDGPVHNYEDARRCDTARFGAFHRAMLEQGIYLPPSQFEAWFISLAHTLEDLERTLDAARAAFREVGSGSRAM
ncbi:MAG: aspartate aminotransferase family protein, partial [Chloroflexota bacterium]|nr:aspartate aminotransferase family protein [Chloroflexota bacterium]